MTETTITAGAELQHVILTADPDALGTIELLPTPVQPVTVALQPASSPTAPVYLAYTAARDARGAAWEALQDVIGTPGPIGAARSAYEAAVTAADAARSAYVQALKDQFEAGL